jgi:hypothetical protein
VGSLECARSTNRDLISAAMFVQSPEPGSVRAGGIVYAFGSQRFPLQHCEHEPADALHGMVVLCPVQHQMAGPISVECICGLMPAVHAESIRTGRNRPCDLHGWRIRVLGGGSAVPVASAPSGCLAMLPETEAVLRRDTTPSPHIASRRTPEHALRRASDTVLSGPWDLSIPICVQHFMLKR